MFRVRGELTRTVLTGAGLVSLMLASAFPLWGSLGGDISSVQADQVHMQGSLKATANTAYAVHEIQGANGTAVREYVSNGGKVFGIAWQGPWHPDMRQLLGNYFNQYLQAVKAQNEGHIRRGPLTIQLPGLVVEMGGHPRSFVGRAYVPEMMPEGVRAEDIR